MEASAAIARPLTRTVVPYLPNAFWPVGTTARAGPTVTDHLCHGTVLRSFCPAELGANQRCASTDLPCTDAESDSAFHADTGGVPWYQAALDWASANGASDVHLEGGALTIDTSNLVPAKGIYAGGVGLRVPRGIALPGSTEPANPTVISAADGVQAVPESWPAI